MAIDGDKTVVVQARVDIRALATLNDYFVQIDAEPTTASELVRLAIELGYLHLLNTKKVRPYEMMSYHEAYRILGVYGKAINKKGQNKRKLHDKLAEEAFIEAQMDREMKVERLPNPQADPRLTAVDMAITAAEEDRKLTIYEWNVLGETGQAHIREYQPSIIPDEVSHD